LSLSIIVALAWSLCAFQIGPAVEAAQCLGATRHVVEPSQPDEPVGVVQVAELSQDRHADRLLGLDELPVEEIDQHLPPAGMQRVLPQFDDRIPYVVHRRASTCSSNSCYSKRRAGRPVRGR
jgi:hypothetical protein